MPVPRITKEDLSTQLESAAPPCLVDVRLKYPYEHSTVKLPDAIRLSSPDFDGSSIPKDKDVVVAGDGQVNLSVYNIMGRKVKTLIDKYETAGRKATAWHGADDSGHPLSAGMYFYRLTAGGKVFTKKMVLMK